MKVLSYLDPEGRLSSLYRGGLSDEEVLACYRAMLLTRAVDERMIALQRQGAISFALSSKGEEGCVAASAMALDRGDWIYPQYREAAALFVRGYPVERYIHQMFGDAKDTIKGRQMPNHFGSREHNVVTVSSPIGTKIPHAAGAAYGMKLKKLKQAVLVYFGDGATSEGDFHAGLNFAAVRKVPALFFCRNNRYAISTKLENQFAVEELALRGPGYGISSCRVDGNDVFAVHEAVRQAREACIEGEGPFLIEALTYRRGAHSTSDDPSVYRSAEEEESWREKDPLLRLRRYLEAKGLWDEGREERALESARREVEKGVEAAKNSPRPPLKSLFEDVYFEMGEHLTEQYRECLRLYGEG